MTITRFKVGDVELFLVYVEGMSQGWEEKLNRIRTLNKDVCIQAVNGFSIVDAEHAGHVAFNVLQAHRFGYNKMRSVEAETVMDLAFKNSFAEAIRLVGVKPNFPVALFSFSRVENSALKALTSVVNEIVLNQVDAHSFRDRAMDWLIETYSFKASKDFKILKNLLIERSSIFYAKYRTHPPKS